MADIEHNSDKPASLVGEAHRPSLSAIGTHIADFPILADVVEVKVNRPLVDPLYPAEWLAEKQFHTVDRPIVG